MLSKVTVWTFRESCAPAQTVEDKFLQHPCLDLESTSAHPPRVYPLCIHSFPSPRKSCHESVVAQARVKTQVVIKRGATSCNKEPIVDPTIRLPRGNMYDVVVEHAEWWQWARVHDVRSCKNDRIKRNPLRLLELLAERVDRLSYFSCIKSSAAYVSPSFTNRRMRVSYFSSRAIEHCGAAQRRPCISI